MRTQKNQRLVVNTTPEVLAKVKLLADQDDRPVSAWIHRLLEQTTKDVRVPVTVVAKPSAPPLAPSKPVGIHIGGPLDGKSTSGPTLKWDEKLKEYFGA